MNKQLLYVLLFLLFSACRQEVEMVEETYENNAPHKIGVYVEDGGKKEKVGMKEYYVDGKLKMKGALENGKRKGRWEYYYPSGNLWSECEYKNGIRHGETVVYYENSIKRYEGRYENDEKAGRWLFFNEKGELLKEETFYP